MPTIAVLFNADLLPRAAGAAPDGLPLHACYHSVTMAQTVFELLLGPSTLYDTLVAAGAQYASSLQSAAVYRTVSIEAADGNYRSTVEC